MSRKPYFIGYQSFFGGPIVLEGPFSDRERATSAGQQVSHDFKQSAVKVSPPFVAYSEIEALKRAKFFLLD